MCEQERSDRMNRCERRAHSHSHISICFIKNAKMQFHHWNCMLFGSFGWLAGWCDSLCVVYCLLLFIVAATFPSTSLIQSANMWMCNTNKLGHWNEFFIRACIGFLLWDEQENVFVYVWDPDMLLLCTQRYKH